MEDLNQIQRTLSPHRNEIFSRFAVKNLAVFGSYARGDQRPNSDIDILVEFDRPVGIEFIDLADYLEKLLKRRVDLVSRKGIKPKYYDQIKKNLEYV
jgi:uncharacterized protein